MTQLARNPFEVYNDIDGTPLEAGYLYFGEYGQNPVTNPVNVYWDSGFTNIASQPIRTINGFADRNGSPAKIYVPGNYSILIRDRKQQTIMSSLFEEIESTAAAAGTVLRRHLQLALLGSRECKLIFLAKQFHFLPVRTPMFISTMPDSFSSNQMLRIGY
jgi:hypothetical protein